MIPGLGNAHLHVWQSGLRCAGADWTLAEYLAKMHGGIASDYTPDDMYMASWAGGLSQINSGTTTIGDWCHNTQTPQHTDSAVHGLMRSGVRAVFLHGTTYVSGDAAHPVHELDRLLQGPIAAGPLVSLGMAIRGPQYSTPEIAVADFRAAAERGLVASMHQSGGRPGPAWEAVRRARLLGARTNITHGAGLNADWWFDAWCNLDSRSSTDLKTRYDRHAYDARGALCCCTSELVRMPLIAAVVALRQSDT